MEQLAPPIIKLASLTSFISKRCQFNFIQQKSPTSVSGEMNACWYSIQLGFKPRLNKVKSSGGCHRFSGEIYRAELDKIWAQIRQGAFDIHIKYGLISLFLSLAI
ncbi:hypothetical protein [Siminovitchia terrae]|uniref:hypothetical protein n=1 Tax=Siminovitchia terrae TaxID=1914933 RepID=UPI001BB3826A|nr:hypothetical protein [Siminovitchia terrae]